MDAIRISFSSTTVRLPFYSSSSSSADLRHYNNSNNSMKRIQSLCSFRPSIPSSLSKTCSVIPFPFQVKSRSFQYLNPIIRNISVAATATSSSSSPPPPPAAANMEGPSDSSSSQPQSAGSFFRSVLSSMEKVYLSRNPTAKAILDLVHSSDGDHVCYDHLAFRTFGVDGYGIDSIAKFFLDFGYIPRDELRFPAKKLKALWFTPPDTLHDDSGSGIDGPLPRIFISELLVDEMSSQAQEVIRKYTRTSCNGNKHAALASALGLLAWGKPLYSDYQQLSRESEYAAWTLVNGYAVNHVTISTHRLKSKLRNIKSLNDFVEDSGFKLNSEGGILKAFFLNPKYHYSRRLWEENDLKMAIHEVYDRLFPESPEAANFGNELLAFKDARGLFASMAAVRSRDKMMPLSPDGFLLQSSTVADLISFHFAGGITEAVPCSYIEFAERLVLPQYQNLPPEEIKEFHRRDGFEVGNADKIFESTSLDQLSSKAK